MVRGKGHIFEDGGEGFEDSNAGADYLGPMPSAGGDVILYTGFALGSLIVLRGIG